MEISKIIAFIFFTYVLIVAIGIESINSTEEGGILQNWHAAQQMEYGDGGGGSGQGKMRGKGDFQNILTIFGTLVYPLSVLAACMFIQQALNAKSRLDKGLFWGCALTCLLILARFIFLGVFSAGIG